MKLNTTNKNYASKESSRNLYFRHKKQAFLYETMGFATKANPIVRQPDI